MNESSPPSMRRSHEAADQFKVSPRATAIDNLNKVAAMGRIQSFDRLSKDGGDEKIDVRRPSTRDVDRAGQKYR